MMKYTLTAMALVLISCTDCSSAPPIPSPPIVTDVSMCAPACEHLRALGCEEGTPVRTGEACPAGMGCKDGTCINGTCQVTCERFCSDVEKSGVWLNPTCVMGIDACNKIETCAPNM